MNTKIIFQVFLFLGMVSFIFGKTLSKNTNRLSNEEIIKLLGMDEQTQKLLDIDKKLEELEEFDKRLDTMEELHKSLQESFDAKLQKLLALNKPQGFECELPSNHMETMDSYGGVIVPHSLWGGKPAINWEIYDEIAEEYKCKEISEKEEKY